MSKTKPKIEKGSEYRGTGSFRRCQAKLTKFILKKKDPVRRCKDINNYVFDLVLLGHTELFSNSLKYFYYICGIKFQKKVSDIQYDVNNISKQTLYTPTDTADDVPNY